MPARRRPSNPLALAVLACLRERPMHPYEIAATLRQRAKHESIKLNYGSLYGVVAALARDGMVEEADTEREGRRPERTIYRLSEAGRLEFVDWLGELLRRPVKEYTQFEAALSLLAGLPPAAVVALLAERARLMEMQIAAERAALGVISGHGLARLFTIEVEYRLTMSEAELRFTRELAREIEAGTLEGLDWWTSAHAELERARNEGRTPAIPAPPIGERAPVETLTRRSHAG